MSPSVIESANGGQLTVASPSIVDMDEVGKLHQLLMNCFIIVVMVNVTMSIRWKLVMIIDIMAQVCLNTLCLVTYIA